MQGLGPLLCACLCDVSWLALGGVECSCFEGRFKGQITREEVLVWKLKFWMSIGSAFVFKQVAFFPFSV